VGASLLGVAQPATATTGHPAKRVSARWVLAHLSVAPASGAASYQRSKFKTWIDADHNGCDTRKEVLIAESKVKVKLGAHCKILSGKWVSWYDGVTTTNPSTFDIDHVVPLEDVWVSSGRKWSAAKRTRYANDLGYAWTLDAVSAHTNRSKGDRDPSQWLPPRNDCTYAIHWVAIKYRWHLTVDTTEKATLTHLLGGSCGARILTVPPRAR
jgi:hypothetical protein